MWSKLLNARENEIDSSLSEKYGESEKTNEVNNSDFIWRHKYTFLAMVFVSIILHYSPYTIIGIGKKGRKRLRFWQIWIKIWLFTVPILILLPLLINLIS